MTPNCRMRGSEALIEELRLLAEVAAVPLQVDTSVCFAKCQIGPNIRIMGGRFFNRVTSADLPDIIAEAVKFSDQRSQRT